jgi:GH15 family glucan-1,4-alpha-glucosidase
MTRNLQLGVVGNCAVAALVDQTGSIVWFCYPRLDGDPVLCALLDARPHPEGTFAIELAGQVASEQTYRRNTPILETVLTDHENNALRIIDFAPRFKRFGRFFRPGTLVRRLEPVRGAPRIRIRLRPRFDYGRSPTARTLGSNHIRYVGPDFTLRLTTDASVQYVAEEMVFVLDRPVSLIFGPDESLDRAPGEASSRFLEETEAYWQDWVRYLSVPFDWQDVVIRSAITLKLCSYEETGAVVAALTTSIPEAPSSGRNWDYRFCWLRDAFFVVRALNQLGTTRTMEEFVRYVTNVASLAPEGVLRPVYGIVPDGSTEERQAAELAGYRGMGPVRIGNAAARQVQNDSYGSVVLAAAQVFFDQRLPEPGNLALFERLERMGEIAARVALEPDASLWEYRGRSSVHTHSAVMCWAACDRLAKIALKLELPERAQRWRAEAVRLHAAILEGAWNAKAGAFVDTFGGTGIDASLLLLPEMGFVAATDERFKATVGVVGKALRRGADVFRYASEDDFGMPSMAFTICTVWYIDALAAIGRREEARELFDNLLARRNHLGLLSEDMDPQTGELWGNFPQSYSMVGLISGAMRLSRSWEEAFWRGS